MNNFISFIDFTNMNDEEKYKLLNKKDYEINRLNNIIDEFNRNYIEIIKRCDEMIKNKYYSNATAIDKYANEIKNIVKYYVPDAE